LFLVASPPSYQASGVLSILSRTSPPVTVFAINLPDPGVSGDGPGTLSVARRGIVNNKQELIPVGTLVALGVVSVLHVRRRRVQFSVYGSREGGPVSSCSMWKPTWEGRRYWE
jgi:hypothetical protein